MKKIIIASDSFKGSLTSVEVAESAQKAIHAVFPNAEVIVIPIADGGEGTTEAMAYALEGQTISCPVHDPLMRPMHARYGICKENRIAFIEMAAASGLPLIPAEMRNPLRTTTYGTGEMIKDALERGCRQIFMGIGGSATNDAGIGMLQALGFRFYDQHLMEVGHGGIALEKIRYIDESQALPQLQEAQFTIACDVNNPFCGANGAAHVFARQKGADEAMIERLDKGMSAFASIIKEKKGIDLNAIPGAGAAGGLGGACIAFLSAQLRPGIEIILELLDFDKRIRGAELIITGEGRLDKQTTMGKAPLGVLFAAQRQNIPVIALGGSIEDVELLNKKGFLSVLSIQPGVNTLEQAMDKRQAMANIQRTLHQYLRGIHFYMT